MGPRAWSLSVEMPISAPMPNCPPSVSLVEALTYTAAESTSLVNLLAWVMFSVTMASEWLEPYRAMWSMAAPTEGTTLTARMRSRYSAYQYSSVASLAQGRCLRVTGQPLISTL